MRLKLIVAAAILTSCVSRASTLKMTPLTGATPVDVLPATMRLDADVVSRLVNGVTDQPSLAPLSGLTLGSAQSTGASIDLNRLSAHTFALEPDAKTHQPPALLALGLGVICLGALLRKRYI